MTAQAVAQPSASRLRPLPIIINLLLLVVLLLAAELVPRLGPHHDLATGLHNARGVVRIERSLGLPDERAVVRRLAARPALQDAANIAYVAFHIPAIAAALVWTCLTRPAAFAWTRAVFIMAMVLTVVGYTVLPTAPPRFLPGTADGASELYGAAARPSGDGAVNALAAFPSGHVVFAAIAGLVVVRFSRRRALRIAGVAYPPLVAALVVATGHHFWLDVLAGAAVVAVAAVAATAALGPRTDRGRWPGSDDDAPPGSARCTRCRCPPPSR